MTKPKHFNLNSDYATTQNDQKGTLSYVIPAGTVIPDGTTGVFQANAILGTRNAYLRPQGETSNNAGKVFSCTTLISDGNVSLSGVGPVSWPVYHSIERTSATSLRAYCEIFNNSGLTMTVNTSQTITWTVNTFLSPFPA